MAKLKCAGKALQPFTWLHAAVLTDKVKTCSEAPKRSLCQVLCWAEQVQQGDLDKVTLLPPWVGYAQPLMAEGLIAVEYDVQV